MMQKLAAKRSSAKPHRLGSSARADKPQILQSSGAQIFERRHGRLALSRS